VPFKKGSSKSTISTNIRECINSYKKSGKVGNTHPRNLKHAVKICTAAAYTSARRSKSKSAVSEVLHNGRK